MSENLEKWDTKKLQEHIRENVKDYGATVVVGALYKKLYGQYPSLGLSGQQASFIDHLIDVLPDA